jgi:hypothetical protein
MGISGRRVDPIVLAEGGLAEVAPEVDVPAAAIQNGLGPVESSEAEISAEGSPIERRRTRAATSIETRPSAGQTMPAALKIPVASRRRAALRKPADPR